MSRRAAFFACTILLAGCATTPPIEPVGQAASAPQGAVGASLIAPPADARRMAADPSRRFIHPNLDADAALPVYPAAQLAHRWRPVVVCVDVAIDAAGMVAAAAARTDGDCAAPEDLPIAPFAEAALTAVRSWTYAPALLCVAPVGAAGGDPCQSPDVVETPTAVRLSYAFRFSQHDGTPEVERVGAP